MTDAERIKQLELRIELLEIKLKVLEEQCPDCRNKPVYYPYPFNVGSPWVCNYAGGGTLARRSDT